MQYQTGLEIDGGWQDGEYSPLDESGGWSWYRPLSVELLRNNLIKKWRDDFGNSNDLIPATGQNAMLLRTSTRGQYVSGNTSGQALVCVNPNSHKFLHDGSPFLYISVVDLGTAGGAGGAVQNLNGTSPGFTISYPSSTGRSIVRVIQNGAGTQVVPPNALTYSDFTFMVHTEVCYGYLADGNDMETYINNVRVATRANWAGAPSSANPGAAYSLVGNSFHRWYEKIIFNCTGKTREQIDALRNRLYNDYILKQRYFN